MIARAAGEDLRRGSREREKREEEEERGERTDGKRADRSLSCLGDELGGQSQSQPEQG